MPGQGRIEGTSYITAGQSRKAMSLGGIIATTPTVALGATATNTNGAVTSSDTSGAAVTLATVVIPAGTLNVAGKLLRFVWYGQTVSNVNAKVLTITLGGTTILSATSGALTASVVGAWLVTGYVMLGSSNGQTTVQLQQVTNAAAPAAGTVSLSAAAPAITPTGDISLVLLTTQSAASDIVTRGILVEVLTEGSPE